MKRYLLSILLLCAVGFSELFAQGKYILPIPSTSPSKAQQAQIARKYGMFIHFGIS